MKATAIKSRTDRDLQGFRAFAFGMRAIALIRCDNWIDGNGEFIPSRQLATMACRLTAKAHRSHSTR
jgi:hypothetical protein